MRIRVFKRSLQRIAHSAAIQPPNDAPATAGSLQAKCFAQIEVMDHEIFHHFELIEVISPTRKIPDGSAQRLQTQPQACRTTATRTDKTHHGET